MTLNASFPNLPNGAQSVPAGDLSRQFALDVQSVSQLNRVARQSPQQATTLAARQFEAMLLEMMLKSMRGSGGGDGLFGSQETQHLTSMYDAQLAQHLSAAGNGIGLADMLQKQLMAQTGLAGQASMTDQPGMTGMADQTGMAGQIGGAAQALSNGGSNRIGINSGMGAGNGIGLAGFNSTKGMPRVSLAGLPSQGDRSGRPARAGTDAAYRRGDSESFLQRMAAPAQAASAASGVPARLVLSQAALESGWGRREIRHPDGAPSHNLFGIKASPNWKGRTVDVMTTEYENGVPRKMVARFRAYDSYDESFSDYAKLMAQNPRYAPVVTARNAHDAAWGLQRANYATDPKYASKLIDIMRQIDT